MDRRESATKQVAQEEPRHQIGSYSEQEGHHRNRQYTDEKVRERQQTTQALQESAQQSIQKPQSDCAEQYQTEDDRQPEERQAEGVGHQ